MNNYNIFADIYYIIEQNTRIVKCSKTKLAKEGQENETGYIRSYDRRP